VRTASVKVSEFPHEIHSAGHVHSHDDAHHVSRICLYAADRTAVHARSLFPSMRSSLSLSSVIVGDRMSMASLDARLTDVVAKQYQRPPASPLRVALAAQDLFNLWAILTSVRPSGSFRFSCFSHSTYYFNDDATDPVPLRPE
jgi:hypothetical protein